MFIDVTYQDWLATGEAERPALALAVINKYRSSVDFKMAQTADRYFHTDGTAVASKTVLKARKLKGKDEKGRERYFAGMEDVVGNRVPSNFFFRFVTQQNQYLLANGVTLENAEMKTRLGVGFDKALEQIGEKALIHGVCFGYWNLDHMESIPAYADDMSGAVALLDERTSEAGVVVQFWQLASDRPLYFRVFEADGLTEYKSSRQLLEVVAPKRAYRQTWMRDAIGSALVGEGNYSALPVIPFYASESRRSELSPAIKSKIDLYDNILSDFGDNLDRANDVYWVLNNFGGTTDDIVQMLEDIRRIKAVANISDGTGNGSTVEPRTIEVPYEARKAALELLNKALYQDFMALSMDSLTGGSLTNVAIETAMTDLNLKCDRYEWQVFAFVQRVLRLVGVETEQIRFKRQQIVNRSEVVQDIMTMRSDIDHETALKLNPYIDEDEIPDILKNCDAEAVSGLPTMEELENEIAEGEE